jgi:RHS repeat-associated protein
VAATDASGTLLWREEYKPYGDRIKREAGSKDTAWYTGKQEEAAFGLTYFGARWYDPNMGRFLAMDPVGFSPDNIHSFSKYAYANNNPYKYLDPDGNSPLDVGFFIIDSIRLGAAIASGNSIAIQSAAVDLAASTVGLISPVPGAGQAIKAARTGSKIAKAAKGRKTDFIVSRDGAVMHNSPSAARQSLESAGMSGKKITNSTGTETGTIHNVPGMKMDVRIMDGGPVHSPRVVTTRQRTRQPVNPANGSNFGNVSRAEQRARSHIQFSK